MTSTVPLEPSLTWEHSSKVEVGGGSTPQGSADRASWPHRSLPLGPARLGGSSQACGAVRCVESQPQEVASVAQPRAWRESTPGAKAVS